MKTVQSIVIAASIILVSANAVAGTIQSGGGFDRVVNNTIVLSAAPTKQAAYQLGLNKLAQLNASSPQQLGLTLNVISSNAEGNTLHLKDGGYIFLPPMRYMMKILTILITSALITLSATVSANNDTESTTKKLNDVLVATFKSSPDSVAESLIPGLYRVMYGTEVVYLSADGQYFISGDLLAVQSFIVRWNKSTIKVLQLNT